MFAMRNLKVLSWVGQNILGNRDGAALHDPRTRAAKEHSKDKAVSQICGPRAVTRVGIDFVPSLHDWKVAWDYVHFSGFLGTRMSLQFTWQAADSVLAAPLVIDLARFAAHAVSAGHSGPMGHLAFFFKDPMDVEDQNLFTQWRKLIEHFAAPEA
jgi:myo-inositol-1-phosphate synthase